MKHKIAAVSYVNTLPFIQGLRSSIIRDQIEVVLAHPARCAELLQEDEVDIALCPVGALEDLNGYHIITDYCIGCDGPVRTVSVYSDVPIEEVSQIILSPESRTSNLLVQILNQEYWKLSMGFLPALPVAPALPVSPGFLCIGDICFQKEKEYTHRTDLGQEWKEWTGMPFVFACWVSKTKIDVDFIEKLNTVFGQAIENIDKLDSFPHGMDAEMMRRYLKKNISYELDQGKMEGMKRFLVQTHPCSLP